MGFIRKYGITILLENDKYSPGSKIRGSVSLNSDKPLKIRNLEVYLIGQKIIRQQMPTFGIDGFKARNSRINEAKYIFFSQSTQIAGEGEYSNQRFFFEIKVPDNILDIANNFIRNKLSTERAYLFLQSARARKILEWDEKDYWFIEARLDMPFKRHLKQKKEIQLIAHQ